MGPRQMSRPLSQFATFHRLANYFWRYKLTASGKALFSGMFLSAMVAWSTADVPIYHLTCGLAAFFAVAVVVGFLMRPRLEIRDEIPESTSAGQMSTARFHIVNRSRHEARDLAVGFDCLPAGLEFGMAGEDLPVLQPGEEATASLTLRARKRGLYVLPPVRPVTTFPFNLCRTAAIARTESRSVLVLPDFNPLARLDIASGYRYQIGGVSLVSRKGESPEYAGSREYRPGDPWRRIDFRSWGRLARPIIREFQEEYFLRLAVVLDTYVPRDRSEPVEGFPELEAAVSLSAAVADALQSGEYIIDVFAAGPELYVFRAGPGGAHFENILEILACVDAARQDPFENLASRLAEELKEISVVVFFFLDWNEGRERLVQMATESGCSVKVVLIQSKGGDSCPMDGTLESHSFVRLTPEQVRGGEVGVL